MIEILPPLPADAAAALALVDALADSICSDQLNLQRNFVHIGQALAVIEDNKYWMGRTKSFSEYLNTIEKRANKKRTQLYHCLGVARDLLPLIPEQDLIDMGISKAITLRRMQGEGHEPTAELVEVAKTQTDQQLRCEIAKATGLFFPQDEPGKKWIDLGQLVLTDGESDVCFRVFNVAAKIDFDAAEQLKVDVQSWKDWQDLAPSVKAALLIDRIFAEFLATYEHAEAVV